MNNEERITKQTQHGIKMGHVPQTLQVMHNNNYKKNMKIMKIIITNDQWTIIIIIIKQ